MAGDDTLFWPSLYGRLAPSRYGEAAEPAPVPDAPSPGDDEDAPAERFGQQAFFTDFDTLRRHVETELVSLLNASCLESALLAAEQKGQAFVDTPRERRRRILPFHNHPHVRGSILNYGLPAMVGASAYALDVHEIERRMRDVILAFEPRIRGDSLRVEILSQTNGRLDAEQPMQFVITGEIRGAGESINLVINTIWDPERLRSEAKVAR